MKKCFYTLIFIFCITLFPSYSFASNYIWSVQDFSLTVSNSLNELQNNDLENPLNIDCGSCILINSQTGDILYSYNCHEKLRPASITKLMSIYIIMENISNGNLKYDTKIPCSEKAESMGGSQIWLTTTENLTVDELLKAICVVSANDAVYALR